MAKIRCLVWSNDWNRWLVRYWDKGSIDTLIGLGYRIRVPDGRQMKLF